MESLIRSNFFISRVERETLQKVARQRGISSAALLRQVLDSFLGIEPSPVEPITFVRPVTRTKQK